jgi:hypothetical protein
MGAKWLTRKGKAEDRPLACNPPPPMARAIRPSKLSLSMVIIAFFLRPCEE